ncbi:protein-tyrosine-phosphatase MKP1-like [Quillaja saponaria]|uniref:Protein-tyrosine-phosphatase MKP1-like n=1 Tax=Quillaja saponaria TaxID=32244 RepID=A0AAD7Q6Q7_QUISA|nr:protein-tyrosine-phosphatase MKP1-like [Quillaja saponaria]
MVGNDDAPANARAPTQLSGSRKMFWRSASWSSSRSSLHNPDGEEKDFADPDGNIGKSNGQNRRFPPAPLTPRSQQNKTRSCLPPLQPLSIARRSLDEWPKAGSDDIGEWPQPPTPSGRGSGERLKLDLSSIQRNPDKNSGLVKRDKIAFFDKECSKVAGHIYLGGDAVARDRDILKQNGITHVLNCVGFSCPEYFQADFMYRTLWLLDSPSEDITSILYDVFDYFEDVREQGGRVFVHCCQGVSRSTSLVIAYLMWREGQSFDDAFQYVKAARGIADPNMGFACQLLQCQKRVHAVPLSPSSLLRMYRIAPHSPYDPLHLVPKMLSDPSPSALDSRGAFIILIPSAIYVWIGKNCESIMERDTRGAVGQLVRYERVQGPILMIREGAEPSYFWDAFANLLPLMEKSGNGVEIGHSTVKRKVDSYDVDFEVFHKAIMGGFVPPFASSENEHETHLPARESSWSVLRRKFASPDMKEFVSAPKLSFSRLYSDSMMLVRSSTNSSLPSLSSMSSSYSSPFYLSPDSLSSDSSNNSKCLSESSLDSPFVASCSHPVSSPLSNFSNLSLISSNCSSQPISNSLKVPDVNLDTQSFSHSDSSPSKKISPSLAERRGSLTKSLKLPLVTDKTRVTNSPSTLLTSQEYGVKLNTDVNLRESESMKKSEKENVEHGEVNSARLSELKIFPGDVASVDSFNKEAVFVRKHGEPWKNNISREGLGFSASNAIDESGSVRSNPTLGLVCHWPSLEKIVNFGASDLDSEAAFAIFLPSASLGKNEETILYFWIGRSFHCDVSQIGLDSERELGYIEVIDWNKVGCDVLTRMGLPKDTSIKIIKENEEPLEFRALLSIL